MSADEISSAITFQRCILEVPSSDLGWDTRVLTGYLRTVKESVGWDNAVRPLKKLNAAVTSRLSVRTALLAAKRYKTFPI
jgi:hypothetical protein